MIPADVMVKLAKLRLSPEKLDAVAALLKEVEAATLGENAAADEARREKGRERWHRWKENRDAKKNDDATNVSKRLPTTANVRPPLARSPARAEAKPLTTEDSGSPVVEVEVGDGRAKRIGKFQPDIGEAHLLGMTPAQARVEAKKFVDHYSDRVGDAGLSHNWPARWRKWVRNELDRERRPAPAGRRARDPPRRENAAVRMSDEIERRLADLEPQAPDDDHPAEHVLNGVEYSRRH